MKYRDATAKLTEYRGQIAEIRERMRSTQAAIEPEDVRDYELAVPDGKVTLSSLFGDKDTLFVIHNMGHGCSSCTMWADGFNGVYHHLRDRAAFVVSSPEAPEEQRSFAASRSWRFPMVSTDRRHHFRRGHGLPPQRPFDAGRVGVQAPGRQDRAGGRYRFRSRRRFLCRLEPVRSVARGPRRLAAEIQLRGMMAPGGAIIP